MLRQTKMWYHGLVMQFYDDDEKTIVRFSNGIGKKNLTDLVQQKWGQKDAQKIKEKKNKKQTKTH